MRFLLSLLIIHVQESVLIHIFRHLHWQTRSVLSHKPTNDLLPGYSQEQTENMPTMAFHTNSEILTTNSSVSFFFFTFTYPSGSHYSVLLLQLSPFFVLPLFDEYESLLGCSRFSLTILQRKQEFKKSKAVSFKLLHFFFFWQLLLSMPGNALCFHRFLTSTAAVFNFFQLMAHTEQGRKKKH